MKYKPKISKIKHKLMAAFVAAISLFCISIPASANSLWAGLVGGSTGNGGFTLSNPPFSHEEHIDQFAWRADLYVSTNADGKIIKSSDAIGNELALVGSVLCTSPNYVKSSTWKTYIQTDYTNETRDIAFESSGTTTGGNSEDIGSVTFALPTLQPFNQADLYYTDASGHKVAIAEGEDMDLFKDQWKIPTEFSKVHSRLTGDDAVVYTTKLIEQLIKKNKAAVGDIVNAINQSIYDAAIAKTEGVFKEKTFNEYILPTGSQPMVEWALVLTPLYRFSCNIPFYYYPSSSHSDNINTYKGLAYFGGVDCVALDAFWMAQYNRTSIALGNNHYYDELTYKSVGGVIKNVWQYQTIGLLSFFLRSYSGAVGSAAYCTEENDPHLGVWTNTSATTQDHWYGLLQGMPKEYAKRGGIAVFTTEITTPEAPVYYHTYTYEIDENNPPPGYTVGTAYTQSDLIKFTKELTPKVTVTKGSKSPEGDFYAPATDTEALEKGVPVAAMTPHPTVNPQPGDSSEEYPTYVNSSFYLENIPLQDPPKPLIASQQLKTGKSTPDNTADDPKEYHVMLIHVDIKPKTPPPPPSEGTDRIKSQDVTQFIEIKPTGNEYLNDFNSYANNNPNNFNRDKFEGGAAHNGGTHTYTTCIRINSIDNRASTNSSVKAKNFLSGTTKSCGFSGSLTNSIGHPYSSCKSLTCSSTESGHKHSSSCYSVTCTSHHHSSHSWSCPATKSTCHWTEEYVDVYYGIKKPTVIQRTAVSSSDSKSISGNNNGKWQSSSVNSSSTSNHATVGVVIPESYYAYKDVVKASAVLDYNDSGATNYNGLVYVLPNKDSVTSITTGSHNIKADKNAVFDILMKDSTNYWIEYLNGSQIVGKDVHQSSTFKAKDIQADWQNSTGDGEFNWLANGTTVNGVHFLAHRDLLSADEVSTSLAVSGYMAKYANDSNTFNYLKFMEKAGFTFKGLDNLKDITNKSDAYNLKINTSEAKNIGHENRVVWIANTATVNDLKATKNGIHANEYNTNFVGGKDKKESINARQMCHFGLGGLAGDGTDIFSRIGDNNLGNITLEKDGDAAKQGDVTRPVYYVAGIREGTTASCFGLDNGNGSDHHDSGCCGSSIHHTCSHKVDYHTSAHNSALAACISNNKYAAKNQDFYKDTMARSKSWGNTTVNSHSGAVSSIEASRLSFEISLGVEGTTAGQYNGAGEVGLIYKPTDADGYEVDDYKLTLKTFKSHANVLTLLAENEASEEAKSWKENTFEVHQSNYQSVGAASAINNSKVVAEYHFTTPTRDFLFNPSYYMLFDDELKDNNKSVWMLSEQERGINFKDILSVRLTQTGSGSSVSTDKAYTTHLSSEWSTDLADTQCHKETNLPVAKAGNAVKTVTEKSGGTVTMYVILQDPEFTSDPDTIKTANKQIMDDYVKQATNILKQFQVAAASNGEKMTTEAFKDKLSMAMYSNVTNLSSLNSGYRVTETNGLPLLNDKEPFRFTSDAELTYKVTTGNKGDSASLSNWSFYALPGYTVAPTSSSYENSTNVKDISDTTSAHKRKLDLNGNVCYIHNIMTNTNTYQKKVINELNDRLCMLMVPQDKSRSESLACPSGTTPYLAGAGDFNWYAEDYEGFVVGVYEIEFTMQGKAKSEAGLGNTAIETKFSTIYRSESDWQASFNELATKSGHDLTVYTPNTFSGFNIDNFMDENRISSIADTKTKKQMDLGSNGTFQLITNQGAKTLKSWSKQKFNKQAFAEGIYGTGLELANLNISFGSSTASNGRNVQVIGGSGTGKPISFYYQPTYFNIRGSVYDTAR